MAIRATHPDHPHGVAYTKHAEISLEEMGMENIVITDIPTSRLLYGSRMTSIGHNLNREILRLRPDIGAVIHVHDDATIAFFGSGAFREVKVLSLDLPFILGKPPHYVPAQRGRGSRRRAGQGFHRGYQCGDSAGPWRHGLGRTISEAYHRLNSLTAEVRRNIEAEHLAALKGTSPLYRGESEIALMHRHAEAVIYPDRAEKVMQG